MAARLLNDEIIVLKVIYQFNIAVQKTKSQQSINNESDGDLDGLTRLQTLCQLCQACWTLSCVSSPFLWWGSHMFSLVDSPTFSSRQTPWLTHLSRQWRDWLASSEVCSQGGSGNIGRFILEFSVIIHWDFQWLCLYRNCKYSFEWDFITLMILFYTKLEW